MVDSTQIEVSAKVPARRVGTLLLLLFFVFSAQAQYTPSLTAWSKTENTLRKTYGLDLQKTALPSHPNYYSLTLADSLIGYLCLEQAPSKHDVFEFLVIYTPELNINKVQILIYRESYGFEIKSKRWLQQFSTRSRKEVQAISGATISVGALKHAITKLNKRMMAWQEAQR